MCLRLNLENLHVFVSLIIYYYKSFANGFLGKTVCNIYHHTWYFYIKFLNAIYAFVRDYSRHILTIEF